MSDTEHPELKFADVFVDQLLRGEKTVTFRIGLDPEIQEGKGVWLCDSSGNRIVMRKVEEVVNMTIEQAARQDLKGHKSYASAEKLVEAMEGYYPDRDIHEHTRIDVVRWKA